MRIRDTRQAHHHDDGTAERKTRNVVGSSTKNGTGCVEAQEVTVRTARGCFTLPRVLALSRGRTWFSTCTESTTTASRGSERSLASEATEVLKRLIDELAKQLVI